MTGKEKRQELQQKGQTFAVWGRPDQEGDHQEGSWGEEEGWSRNGERKEVERKREGATEIVPRSSTCHGPRSCGKCGTLTILSHSEMYPGGTLSSEQSVLNPYMSHSHKERRSILEPHQSRHLRWCAGQRTELQQKSHTAAYWGG